MRELDCREKLYLQIDFFWGETLLGLQTGLGGIDTPYDGSVFAAQVF